MAVASLAVLCSFIEPHLALPAAIGLSLYAPRTRVFVGLGIVLLGLASLATLGLSTNIEYFTSVLPAHVLSEIFRDTQYSLTELLVSFGFPLSSAIEAGTIWYVAMVALGLFVGLVWHGIPVTPHSRYACRRRSQCSVERSFMRPRSPLPSRRRCLLATYSNGKTKTAAVIALLALSVPWGWVVSLAVLVSPPVPGRVTSHSTTGKSYAARCWPPSPLQHIATAREHAARQSPTIQTVVGIDHKLAEYSWSEFTQTFTRARFRLMDRCASHMGWATVASYR